jgi:hypothetical protein
LAGDLPRDFAATIDFAGLRADPLMAKVLAKAEASAPEDVRALVKKLDRLDAQVGRTESGIGVVAIAWGALPGEPGALGAFAPDGPYALGAAKRGASGVREYPARAGGGGSVFVVDGKGWILTLGSPTDTARARLAEKAALPPPPDGDLVHLEASSSALRDLAGTNEGEGATSALASVERAEISLTAGAGAFDVRLLFHHDSDAATFEQQLRGLSSLLAAALTSGSDCKAIDKLSVLAERKGRNVRLQLQGIGEAAEAWDPTACTWGGGSETDPGSSTIQTSSGTKTKLCPLMRGKKIPSLPIEKEPGWPRDHRLVSLDVIELDGSDGPLADGQTAYEAAAAYAEWAAAVGRACKAQPSTRGTGADILIANRIAARMKALCAAIKADPKIDKTRRCR